MARISGLFRLIAGGKTPELEIASMSQVYLMIDQPTPFSPLSEWKEHLEELAVALSQYGATPELREAIRVAERAIADLT